MSAFITGNIPNMNLSGPVSNYGAPNGNLTEANAVAQQLLAASQRQQGAAYSSRMGQQQFDRNSIPVSMHNSMNPNLTPG